MANGQDGLDKAYDFAKKGNYAEALAICDDFIASNPAQLAGYRERASIFLHKNDIESALMDLKKLEKLDSKEPSDFFDLGRAALTGGYISESVEALSRSLELSTQHRNKYYVNTCLLLRAMAHLELGHQHEAQEDLEQLPEDASFYVSGHGMVSTLGLRERLEPSGMQPG